LELPSVLEHFPYLGLFLLLFLGEIGLPFPEDGILLLSGFLVAQGITRLVPTLLVVYMGLLITDFSLYWAGKKYGRKIVEHKRFHRILPPERLANIEERFKKWGIWVILIGRHIFGVRAQIFLAAGALRMPPVAFIVSDAISALITVGLMVGIGYFGGSQIEVWKKDMTHVEHLAILALLILLATGILFRYFYFRNRT